MKFRFPNVMNNPSMITEIDFFLMHNKFDLFSAKAVNLISANDKSLVMYIMSVII